MTMAWDLVCYDVWGVIKLTASCVQDDPDAPSWNLPRTIQFRIPHDPGAVANPSGNAGVDLQRYMIAQAAKRGISIRLPA